MATAFADRPLGKTLILFDGGWRIQPARHSQKATVASSCSYGSETLAA